MAWWQDLTWWRKTSAEQGDPDRQIDQMIAALRQELLGMRQALAQCLAAQHRLRQQTAQNQTQGDLWQDRARWALHYQREDLARQALARRQELLGQNRHLQEQIAQYGTMIAQLRDGAGLLEQKITEASLRQADYRSRLESAAALPRVREWLAQLSPYTDLYGPMEAKVLALEARALDRQIPGGDPLEWEFRQLLGEDFSP